MKKHIHIIKMGGTIEFVDPAYDEINRLLLKLDTTVDAYLRNIIKPHFTFSVETIAEKDSREITAADRERLLKTITSTEHNNILITHGTFTLTETAQFLENKVGDKKVILTGSMIPITGLASSDAGFNLGYSISAFDHIDSGIYVCMNGDIARPEEMEKNVQALRFE